MGHASSLTTPPLASILTELHDMGREVIAPQAASVDREARFPEEAFAALRRARLLSCYVPAGYGGMGLTIGDLSRICETLALYCASTAMVFAMHQIQVACIVHHAQGSPRFRAFLEGLAENQWLLASATTELGVGGDVRTSLCAVEVEGDRFSITKKAPVISYGLNADAILVTARRAADAGPGDQVHVLTLRDDTTLEPMSGWDTLGFRGTCSLGFTLRSRGRADQVLPAPYAEIHAKTMHAFSHCVWASLWLGIATDAVNRARGFVRAEARKTPGTLPPSALRLAEVDAVLFTFRSCVQNTVAEYQRKLESGDDAAFASDYAFSSRVNSLKVTASQLVVEVVGKAMLICGIAGYRNDSPHSLTRQLRDAYGAALMVNNDRILGQSSTMQLFQGGS